MSNLPSSASHAAWLLNFNVQNDVLRIARPYVQGKGSELVFFLQQGLLTYNQSLEAKTMLKKE